MTPERKEEIKGYIRKLHNPEQYSMDEFHNAADIMDERKVEWTIELLTALEESQQEQDYAKQQAIYWNDEAVKIKRQLAEAQQTIARLTAALILERDDALTWDGIGTVNRINKVLEGEQP
jgi:hypothetical protein